ncbi:MAG TPA: DUF1565 domain-containing protein, partial [Bryobacteraceae bacterium]|nr:DUF1565 domain-containing protein [Bryobacteraceae bacterium]
HVTEANIWRVSGEINTAIQNARPGDTVLVAPGTYNEQIRLRDGISVVSERPRGATLRASAVAVTGDDLRSARLQGFRIQPDDNMYLQTGIQLTGSRAEIVDNEITGTVTAGIELQNSPETLLLANTVIARSRAAVVIGGDGQGPRLSGNYLAAQSDPAIRVTGPARPSITGNTIRAADPLFLPPGQKPEELLRSNIVLSPEGKDKAPTRGNAPARVR